MKIQAYLRISVFFLSLIHFCCGAATCQVIDMHMHGYMEKDFATGVASSSIHFLNSFDFLTEEEKQMILYKNARVFLGTMDITSGNNSKK
jgi:hypothetical protein